MVISSESQNFGTHSTMKKEVKNSVLVQRMSQINV